MRGAGTIRPISSRWSAVTKPPEELAKLAIARGPEEQRFGICGEWRVVGQALACERASALPWHNARSLAEGGLKSARRLKPNGARFSRNRELCEGCGAGNPARSRPSGRLDPLESGGRPRGTARIGRPTTFAGIPALGKPCAIRLKPAPRRRCRFSRKVALRRSVNFASPSKVRPTGTFLCGRRLLFLVLLLVAAAGAATRPRYGGTLRVETRQSPPSPEAFGVPKGFLLGTWEAGKRVIFLADENAPGGRPFLDAVEIQMGRSLRDQSADLELGKADLVELGPNELRRQVNGRRVWTSSPTRLLALAFGPRVTDARVREALALSVNREAIYSVLLQRQGEISGALLPQWLTGYAFLFAAPFDVAKAGSLVAGMPAGGTHFLAGLGRFRQCRDRQSYSAQRTRRRPHGLAGAGFRQRRCPAGGGAHRLRRTRRTRWPAWRPRSAWPNHRRRRSGRTVRRRTRPDGGLPRDSAIPLARRLWRRPAGPRRAGHHAVGRVAFRQPVGGRAAMTFRTRLLLIFAVAVAAAVGMVELVVSSRARAVLRKHGSAPRVTPWWRNSITNSAAAARRSCGPWKASPLPARRAKSPSRPIRRTYSSEAETLASTNRLDLLELVAGEGTIVSSAQWPARFGYKDDWLPGEPDWHSHAGFSEARRTARTRSRWRWWPSARW